MPMVLGCDLFQMFLTQSTSRISPAYKLWCSYYTRGDYIPGLWVDGMDALAVKAACAFAKKFVLEHGPLVIEFDTYRYHGHSISDPGSTYRTRDEIQGVRRARDPIEHVRTLLLENNFATEQELKKLEKQIKQEVQDAVEDAQQCKEPPIEDLWNNVYLDGLGATMRPIQIGLPRIPRVTREPARPTHVPGQERRRADLRLHTWEEGRDLYIDIVGSSPLTVANVVNMQHFVPGGAAACPAQDEQTRYAVLLSRQPPLGAFQAFSFDTFGGCMLMRWPCCKGSKGF
eukprot:jgi/Botrbrau1/18175/Bobra.53_1s0043.1